MSRRSLRFVGFSKTRNGILSRRGERSIFSHRVDGGRSQAGTEQESVVRISALRVSAHVSRVRRGAPARIFVTFRLPSTTSTMAPPPPPPAPDTDSVLDRLQSFVSDNKRALLIGAAAAAVAAGAVVYYASASQPGAGDGKRRKEKKAKKTKKVGEDDGPILEEREPKKGTPSVASVESEAGACNVMRSW